MCWHSVDDRPKEFKCVILQKLIAGCNIEPAEKIDWHLEISHWVVICHGMVIKLSDIRVVGAIDH